MKTEEYNPGVHTTSKGVASPSDHAEPPFVNAKTFSVEWKSKVCKLGNNNRFRLVQVLYEHRNEYVSYQDLIESVWGGTGVKDNTIQKTVCNLKAALARAGIEGWDILSEPGHYGLFRE